MKKPKPPSLVTVSVITTITVILWVFFGVYQILKSSISVDISPEVLAPISPNLDERALAQIQQRLYFDDKDTTRFLSFTEFDIRPERESTTSPETITINETQDLDEYQPESTESADLEQ